MELDDGRWEQNPEKLNKMAVLAISYHNIGLFPYSFSPYPCHSFPDAQTQTLLSHTHSCLFRIFDNFVHVCSTLQFLHFYFFSGVEEEYLKRHAASLAAYKKGVQVNTLATGASSHSTVYRIPPFSVRMRCMRLCMCQLCACLAQLCMCQLCAYLARCLASY